MSKVKNQTVFISGATSGLGLQAAEYFVKSGKSVIFCARCPEDVIRTRNYLSDLSRNDQPITGFANDVSNADATKEMIDRVLETGNFIDILICNAGVIGPINKFLETDLQEWQDAFNINLYGTMNLIMSVLPSMVSRKFGRVIHISGGGATSPLYGMSSYAASKAAAVRFIETLSLEYEDSGVTFNSIAPGMLKTKLLDQMLDAGPDRIGENLFKKSLHKADSSSDSTKKALELMDFLTSNIGAGITGRLISAEWDNWTEWPNNLDQLKNTDLYTLRRITGRDRGQQWGDL
jgi:NAD(P)-dependent dehydrogenase (short-subunit alcohol dehydrogenase family)